MKKKDSASLTTTSAPIIRYRESIAYDENGEIVSDVLYRAHHENGSGFVLCYMSSLDDDIIKKVPQASILRVFFHIAFNQSYDIASGGGFKCSRKHLQETLNLTNRTIISALKWLEEHFLVKEAIINGQSDFMVNPDYATIGKEKKKRVDEWNRRCQDYIKKLESKKTVIAGNFQDSSSNSEVVSG